MSGLDFILAHPLTSSPPSGATFPIFASFSRPSRSLVHPPVAKMPYQNTSGTRTRALRGQPLPLEADVVQRVLRGAWRNGLHLPLWRTTTHRPYFRPLPVVGILLSSGLPVRKCKTSIDTRHNAANQIGSLQPPHYPASAPRMSVLTCPSGRLLRLGSSRHNRSDSVHEVGPAATSPQLSEVQRIRHQDTRDIQPTSMPKVSWTMPAPNRRAFDDAVSPYLLCATSASSSSRFLILAYHLYDPNEDLERIRCAWLRFRLALKACASLPTVDNLPPCIYHA
ncbi:hypothetical protein LXA43DRAFT_1095627 [Ganoderma leucocontextum]|nr:hypothetical protein LXA43DRAFT_1095627 [Ganoderma leucocontextum]